MLCPDPAILKEIYRRQGLGPRYHLSSNKSPIETKINFDPIFIVYGKVHAGKWKGLVAQVESLDSIHQMYMTVDESMNYARLCDRYTPGKDEQDVLVNARALTSLLIPWSGAVNKSILRISEDRMQNLFGRFPASVLDRLTGWIWSTYSNLLWNQSSNMNCEER